MALESPLSSVEIGKAIDRHLKAEHVDRANLPGLRELVVQLAETRCETTADALACLVIGRNLVEQVGGNIAVTDPEDAQLLLGWANQLNSRAIEALERATGLTAAGFLGSGPIMN